MTPSTTVSMKKNITNRNIELQKFMQMTLEIIDKYYYYYLHPLESIILMDGGTSVLAIVLYLVCIINIINTLK